MTSLFPLAVSLAGLAIFDSINPSLFVAQIYLLTTPKPFWRVVTYILGVVTIYLIGGVVIMLGLREVVGDVIAGIPPSIGVGLQLFAGIALVIFGWRASTKPMEMGEGARPRFLSPCFTFFFGMFVMVQELTTALPYFVAIEHITAQQLSPVVSVALLVAYNLIFSLPLFAFLWLFMRNQVRFAKQIEAVQRWIARWMPRLLKFGALIFGAILLANSIPFFLTGQALF